MHRHRTPEDHDELARLDGAVLGLLVDPDDHRPWSETEIAREISTPGSVPECLERLRDGGLVHRCCCGLVVASHAATRCYDIEQGHGPREEQRSLEDMILGLALEHPVSEGPPSREDFVAELGDDRRLTIIDALDSLRGAGLIDRSGEFVTPSRAARTYSQIAIA
ncbi:MAG TPA: hypothetical protein VK730_06900 [Solirubrobacteraceae bacterium]|jgi:hypothetical protein|nr:hypothetical protein [Solirubrobacteraceae bacterium]